MSYASARGFGLGQKQGGQQIDNTGRDWSAAAGAAGSLIGGLIGQQPAAPAYDPTLTPAYVPPVSASPDWYWPVIIGVGVAVLGGIGYMSYGVKGPVRANRGRRRVRRNRRRSSRRRVSRNGGKRSSKGMRKWVVYKSPYGTAVTTPDSRLEAGATNVRHVYAKTASGALARGMRK